MVKAFVFDPYGMLFDVQSVAEIADAAFPGHGDYITQVWRPKQLEYSWLRPDFVISSVRDLLDVAAAPRDKDPSLSLRASARVATRGRRPPPRPASRPPS